MWPPQKTRPWASGSVALVVLIVGSFVLIPHGVNTKKSSAVGDHIQSDQLSRGQSNPTDESSTDESSTDDFDVVLYKGSESLFGIQTRVTINKAGMLELEFSNTTTTAIVLQHAVEEQFQGLQGVVQAQVRHPSGEIAYIEERPTDLDGNIKLFHMIDRIRFMKPILEPLLPGNSYHKIVNLREELAHRKLDTIEGSQVRFRIRPNFLREGWLIKEIREMKLPPRPPGGVMLYPGTIRTEWIDLAEWPLRSE